MLYIKNVIKILLHTLPKIKGEKLMNIIKALSIIGLASFLILQGLFYLAELQSPIVHAGIGLLGLISGALMFISLNHWVHEKIK